MPYGRSSHGWIVWPSFCALAFFAALGFGVAGAVEAGMWLSGDSDRRETMTTRDGDVYPDDCQPGVPYLNC